MSRKRGLTAAALLLLAAGALLAVGPLPPLSQGLNFSQAVYDRQGRLLRLTLTRDGKYRLWLPLSDVSPLLVDATLLHEDKTFWHNPGADLPALVRSAWLTYVKGQRRVGGSTITMQLARLRYGIDSRTIPGKLLQIARAFELEAFYSKEEILEAYLNLVPEGGNIEGVGAASLVYFGKEADCLTLSEALALAVIPQNPVRRTLTGAGSQDARAREEAKRVLYRRWLKRRPQDASQKLSVEEPQVPRSARELPFEAPQFVDAALGGSRAPRLLTTLDLGKQRLAERLVRRYVERRRAEGIRNAAVLLVDDRDMSVVASVGSADFSDPAIKGQVDGTRARRSPGSALKPFVYALALDQGLIHEQTMLKDAPSSFGAYDPENFDGDFEGPIKAHDALIKSRNVPAVALASRLAPPGLYGLLKQAGVQLDFAPEHYGLGIVLGGAEVTMEDLAVLYGALANGGLARPLRRTLSGGDGPARRLFSREAAFIVMQMLKDNPRPQGFSNAWTRQSPPVYWKTGTSFAFRDAWTAGVVGPYVVVVWAGNFDGTGNPAFVGVEAAAPLFFELADALRAQEPLTDVFAQTRTSGLNVRRVRVCAVSGMLPGPHCKDTMWAWFIPGVSPIARCDVHREVLVDARTGLRACAGAAASRLKAEVFEVWPSDLLKLFRAAGVPRRVPPPYGPGCALAQGGPSLPPRISSPLSGVTYLLRVGAPDPIPLSASADGDARRLYWFVDQAPVGDGPPGRPLFWNPQPGRYVVRVIDDRGRSDAREVQVAASQ